MSSDLICVGTILEFKDKSPFWRAIVRAVYPNEVLLADLSSGEQDRLPLESLLSRIDFGTAKFLSCFTDFNDMNFADLTKGEQETVIRRRKYVEHLKEKGFALITSKSIDAIADFAKSIDDDSPPHWQTVRSWFKSYFEHGRSLAGLYSRDRFKGRREPRIDAVVINIINKEMGRYLRQAQPCLASLHFNVRTEVIKHNLKNPLNVVKVPVYNTVKARVENATYEEKKKKREGPRSNRNSLAGTEGVTTSRILERVEVDHTKLDIYVFIDHVDSVAVRPHLTVYIDHFSKAILGFLLSFEPGSFAGVCAASRIAFLTKNASDKYGALSDWPMHGIPELIVTDNGNEFLGVNFSGIADELNCDFQYCPIRTPNYKGSVERFFLTVKTMFLDDLPGVIRKKDEAGEDYDARSEAKLTFSELKAELTKWIVDIYHHRPRSEDHRTPYELWTTSEAEFSVPIEEENDLLQKIMAGSLKMNRKGGIHIHKLPYESDVLKDLRRRDGNRQLKIKYDPFDLGEILVFDDKSNVYFLVECGEYDYAKGLSLYEHNLIRSFMLESRKEKLNNPRLEQAEITFKDAKDSFHARRGKPKSRERAGDAARTARLKKIGIDPILSAIEPTAKDIKTEKMEVDFHISTLIDLDIDDDSDLDGWGIE